MSYTDLIQFITKITRHDDTLANNIGKVRKALKFNNINTSFDNEGRMCLYVSKKNRFNYERDNTLIKYGGTVIDISDHTKPKILVKGHFSYISNINPTDVQNNMNSDMYDVYHLDDGTTVRFYYWAPSDKWCISTPRNHDSTDYKCGEQTYKSLISDILVNTYHTSWDKFCEELDKNMSYTFGFKHSSIHPFLEGQSSLISKMWFIHSFLSETGSMILTENSLSNDNTHTNYEEKYEKTEKNEEKYTELYTEKSEDFQEYKAPEENNTFDKFNIPNQKKVNITDIKSAFKLLSNAYKEFLLHKTVFYGFLFVSKTGTVENIILESSLLRNIRNLIYHPQYKINNTSFNHDVINTTFNVAYHYLSINHKQIFINLFPQYNNMYCSLDKITGMISDCVINLYNTKSSSVMSDVDYENNLIDSAELNPYINSAAAIIYSNIIKKYNLVVSDFYNTKVITSYIHDIQFILFYVKIFEYITQNNISI